MTNEEMKKKIAQIMADYFCPKTREDEDGEYSYKVEFETKYCPNCGAKVEEEE